MTKANDRKCLNPDADDIDEGYCSMKSVWLSSISSFGHVCFSAWEKDFSICQWDFRDLERDKRGFTLDWCEKDLRVAFDMFMLRWNWTRPIFQGDERRKTIANDLLADVFSFASPSFSSSTSSCFISEPYETTRYNLSADRHRWMRKCHLDQYNRRCLSMNLFFQHVDPIFSLLAYPLLCSLMATQIVLVVVVVVGVAATAVAAAAAAAFVDAFFRPIDAENDFFNVGKALAEIDELPVE